MRIKSQVWRVWLFCGVLCLLPACAGGAVQFAPTPLPADVSVLRYAHPSGAFAVSVPRNWSIHEQNLTTLASALFVSPQDQRFWLSVAAINLGSPPDDNRFGQILQAYQTQIRPSLQSYTETDRQLMPDGSWRLSGIRQTAGGLPEPLNTFIQRAGSLLIVVDVAVPPTAGEQLTLEIIANTVEALEPDGLEPTEFSALASLSLAPLVATDIATWTTGQGVFYIAGGVQNRGTEVVPALEVRVALLAADGIEVAGALDRTMGHGIVPGGDVPFSFRFGQGQPAEARTFRITIVPPDEDPPQVITDFEWTDAPEFSPDGILYVSGTVTNISANAVRDPLVIVAVLNEADEIVGAAFAPTDAQRLNPAETARYVVAISELGGNAATYILTVQGLACEEPCL